MRHTIEHLLKLEYSQSAEPRADWRHLLVQARDEIEDHMTPTLRREVEADLAKTCEQARRRADVALRGHGEHDTAKALPATCPYNFEQIVSQDWYPKNRHGIVDDEGA